MEQDNKRLGIDKRIIIVTWSVVCCIAALFIPYYDFGFDGVKVWFFICMLMLVGLVGGAWLFQALHQRT